MLGLRRERPALFAEGGYGPIEIAGEEADWALGFVRESARRAPGGRRRALSGETGSQARSASGREPARGSLGLRLSRPRNRRPLALARMARAAAGRRADRGVSGSTPRRLGFAWQAPGPSVGVYLDATPMTLTTERQPPGHNVTAATALILARMFGNSPDFWLNVQRRSDLWEAMNSPRQRKRIERSKPLGAAA